MKVTLIPREHVSKVWPKVENFLNAALHAPESMRHDETDLLTDCLTGRQLLWVVFDEDTNEITGAMTTFVVVYPQYSCLSIPYMGGKGVWKMRDEIMRTLSSFARDNDFKTIECYGRDEWGRIGRKYGFRKAYSVFEVDVANVNLS